MDPCLQANLGAVERDNLSFHHHLLETLSDLTGQLEQLTVNDSRAGPNQQDYFGNGVLEVLDSYNYAMMGLNTFLNTLDAEAAVLDAELEDVEAKKNSLLLERDSLIEKGHELNCRMAYNALVRKLDESFISLEKNTSEDSAKCFKEEADECLKRTTEMIRVASMTSCTLDRDIFREMEKITNLFENYERDRDLYVKELDLFSDVRRQKISSWLADPRTDEETDLGESALDYLNLTQRQRHMEVQVIKNALRMYSFNASLNFDREDNLRLMDELTHLQHKVNALSGVTNIFPRAANAKTNLTCQDDNSGDEADPSAGDTGREEKKGKGLHRCPRQVNLATDPVTDPELVVQLEAALRWEDRSTTPTCIHTDSLSEYLDQPLASSDSMMELGVKAVDSICGDANVMTLQMEHSLEAAANDEGKTGNMSECMKSDSHSTQNFLCHIESSTVLPGSEMKIPGLVRKKHNIRPVGSLSNVADIEKEITNQKQACHEERQARSQGNEPAPKLPAGTNKSREHVQNPGNASELKRNTACGNKDIEDEDN
ncbi:hypothetical protein BsWGS_15781 [Bradybaena similaris]